MDCFPTSVAKRVSSAGIGSGGREHVDSQVSVEGATAADHTSAHGSKCPDGLRLVIDFSPQQAEQLRLVSDSCGLQVEGVIKRAVAVYAHAVIESRRGNSLELVSPSRHQTVEIVLP